MDQFQNEATLRAWLETYPHDMHVAFAARCALRVLPSIGDLGSTDFRKIALEAYRAALIAAVSVKFPNEEIVNAAETANTYVVSGAFADHKSIPAFESVAFNAAFCAANSVPNSVPHSAVMAAAHGEVFSNLAVKAEARQDAKNLIACQDPSKIFDVSLWHEAKIPKRYSSRNVRLKTHFLREPDIWPFWDRWYYGMLHGRPMDWDLQEQVALIPAEDWEKGPAHVARMIRGIERDFLAAKAPLAETIEFNHETDKFHAVPRELAKPDLVASTVSQVADAMEDALADQTNGLHSESREVRVINRVLEKYRDDPQQIELNLVAVAVGLRRQIHDTCELPNSEENLALLNAAEDGAVAIRATHPDVAENREILARQRFVELPQKDKDLLAAAQDTLVHLTEGQISDDFAFDIPELLNTSIGPAGDYAPPLPGATRTFGRIASISQAAEDPSVIKRIKSSDAFQAIEIAGAVAGFISLLSALVSVGLTLFGVL